MRFRFFPWILRDYRQTSRRVETMAEKAERIVLTGFMGVGKSTVARHLSRLTGRKRVDLDDYIERAEGVSIPDLISTSGIDCFRDVETARLLELLSDESAAIISLGGGAWTLERNREIIRENGVTAVWLESTFEHCWRNIKASRKERPLVKDRAQALRMFEERERHYCLADWHFVIDRGYNSFEIAQRIAADILTAAPGNSPRKL